MKKNFQQKCIHLTKLYNILMHSLSPTVMVHSVMVQIPGFPLTPSLFFLKLVAVQPLWLAARPYPFLQ